MTGDLLQLCFDLTVFSLFAGEFCFLCPGFVQGLCDVLVGTVVLRMFLLRNRLFTLASSQFLLQELNNVHISAGNLRIVVLNLLVLSIVLRNNFLNLISLLRLNLSDRLLPS